MTSPIVAATLQSALLAAASNILAQTMTAHKNGHVLSIDWVPVFQFLVFTLVSTPPNFVWQQFLESSFPAHPQQPATKTPDSKHAPPPPPPPPPRLSIANTLLKLLLDQSLAAAFNTLFFSIFTRSLRAGMHPAPRISSFVAAAKFWSSPGAIDFARVDFDVVLAESLDEFWPLVKAGARLWPAVALVNFTLIKSVEGRNLVGALAGVAWGVYICMATGS